MLDAVTKGKSLEDKLLASDADSVDTKIETVEDGDSKLNKILRSRDDVEAVIDDTDPGTNVVGVVNVGEFVAVHGSEEADVSVSELKLPTTVVELRTEYDPDTSVGDGIGNNGEIIYAEVVMLELKIDAARVNDDDGSRSVENVSISELEPLATITELLARADLDTSMEVEEVVVGIVGEVNETQAAIADAQGTLKWS